MWMLFALTSASILASRKVQEKYLVGSIWGALGWMIRVGSVTSACILWLIFSRDLSGIMHPTVIFSFIAILIIFPFQLYTYYHAMHELPFSLFGMMAPIVPITATIASHYFHGSNLSTGWVIGIICITIGLIWLFWKHDQKEIRLRFLIFGVITYMLMGIWQNIDKFALNIIDPYTYTLLNQWIILVEILILSPFLYHTVGFWFFKKNFTVIFMIGITQGISYLCAMYALSHAPNVGYATAIANTHAIITSLYGVLVLWEKITWRKIFVFFAMMLALVAFAFA
jgi:uncharacterized membrane protein